MKKLWFRRLLPILLLASLFLMFYQIYRVKSIDYYANGQNFNIVFASSSFQFQNDINKYVKITVTEGLLNSTTNNFEVDAGGGSFRFVSINSTKIKIDYSVSTLKASGDQNNAFRNIPTGTILTIDPTNEVFIQWDITLAPLLPIMFILGMVGLLSMFGGPLYAIYEVKHHEYYEGFRTGLIVTVLGIALFIAWLWH